jgi:hypothetical protein
MTQRPAALRSIRRMFRAPRRILLGLSRKIIKNSPAVC